MAEMNRTTVLCLTIEGWLKAVSGKKAMIEKTSLVYIAH